MTVEKILRTFIMQRLSQGKDRIQNGDMSEVRQWAIDRFDIMHTAGTYERGFRKLKEKVRSSDDPQIKEFREVPMLNKKHTVWQVIPNDSQQSMF